MLIEHINAYNELWYCVSILEYGGELDWCEGAREILDNLPKRNGRLLQYILQLLHHYNVRHADKGYLQSLAAVFSPLLLCGEFHGIATPDTTLLMAKLIAHYGHIYGDRQVILIL